MRINERGGDTRKSKISVEQLSLDITQPSGRITTGTPRLMEKPYFKDFPEVKQGWGQPHLRGNDVPEGRGLSGKGT